MRRAQALVVCVLGIVLAVPEAASARSRHFPFPRVIAAPLQMMFGHAARAHHRHRIGRATRTPKRDRNIARAAPQKSRTAVAQFWPTAYGDLLEPVLWPGDGDRFWTHGYADVLDTIFTRSANTAREEDSCAQGVSATQAADDLSSRLEKAVQPNPSQRERLAALRTAFAAAFERIRTTCSDTSQTPPLRLRAVVDRLLAMRQALFIVRGPLEHFYDALDDAQKVRLRAEQSATGQPDTSRAEAQARAAAADTAQADPRQTDPRQTDPRLAALSGLCASQMGAVSAWPAEQIERDLKPTKEQRPAFEAVRMISGKMGQFLAASCPPATPATPIERLSAALERLNTMFYAVSVINRPLGAFYGSLDDRQKARFRQLRLEGRPATTAER